MKFRGTYLKVTDLNKCISFYKGLLGVEPREVTRSYYEFPLENGRLGISLNDYGDKYLPSNAVPVFSVTEEEAKQYLERVLSLGGKLNFNGIAEPTQRCIVCLDPCGNEIEFNALPL